MWRVLPRVPALGSRVCLEGRGKDFSSQDNVRAWATFRERWLPWGLRRGAVRGLAVGIPRAPRCQSEQPINPKGTTSCPGLHSCVTRASEVSPGLKLLTCTGGVVSPGSRRWATGFVTASEGGLVRDSSNTGDVLFRTVSAPSTKLVFWRGSQMWPLCLAGTSPQRKLGE